MPKAVLLADDSLTIQKVVELTFSDTNYELTTVSNGVEALEAMKRSRPDLVIADVVMPGKNGYEVCEEIKSNAATSLIPVILLSGTFEPFDRERAERARADAIVTKPFDSKNLLSQVEALLASAAPAQPIAAAPAAEPAESSFLTQSFASAPAPETPVLESESGFETPEPVPGDIESAIAEYEKRESGMIDAGGLEEPEPAPVTAPYTPPAYVPPPPSLPAEAAHVEPLDFTLDDTSPFRAPAPAEPPPVVEERAVFAAEDNVFEFPAGPSAEPPAAAPPEPATPFGGEELFPEPPAVETPAPLPEPAAAQAPPARGEVPSDIERLAQSASISDLASMVHRVAPGSSLSDEDLDRLSRKVIEHLSEKIIREIAWEVIPDMAEMVVRKRIEELEAEAGSESK